MRLERRARRGGTHLIITSLVDVMLVLLFFFMLTTGYGAQPRALPLQLAAPAAAHGTQGEMHEVRMQAGGMFLYDGAAMPLPQIKASAHGLRVSLRPEAGVKLQQLLDALEALRSAGASVALGT